jgi:hypothetical protein
MSRQPSRLSILAHGGSGLLHVAIGLALSLVFACHGGSPGGDAPAQGTAPAITTQPASQMVTVGQTATFAAVATGTAPLSYQWSRNGNPIAGATSATYTTPATVIADSGAAFVLTVSNGIAPAATSHAAILTVSATATAPSITTQPSNQVVTVGQSATFTAAATGSAPLAYQWNRNGSPISGATSASYTTPPTILADSGAAFTLTVSNGVAPNATSDPATLTVNPAGTSVNTPRILPNAISLAAQKIASSNPAVQAQWTTFLATLDAGLPVVVPSEGIYQASELEAIPDYALAYRLLRGTDQVRAEKYADKAIALMRSALHDHQKGDWVAEQFLARGNGSATTFTLPNADLDLATLEVLVGPVTTFPVVKGATGGQDDTGEYYSVFLKASRTSDGPADFVQGVDWRHNGDWPASVIDWSLNSANQPASGSTYFVTQASPYNDPILRLSFDAANPTNPARDISVDVANHTFTIRTGSAFTLAAPPSAAQAVFVQYSYGTHAADYSTLAYQQTSMGDGGFNSAFIDTGYTSRYLGKDVALGYDWLYDYPGFSPVMKAEVETMLGKWYNYYRNHGYYYGHPGSNYGAGEYISNLYTALALQGRASFAVTDGSAANQFDGATVVDPATSAPITPAVDMLALRNQNLVPLLTGAITATTGQGSLKGGWWAEGWNYGQMATRSLLLGGLALEQAGLLSQATEERAWAGEVIATLIHAQPDQATIYDGGDWYAYPAPFVGKDLLAVLASACSDGTAKGYASHILSAYPGNTTPNAVNLLLLDPTATGPDWSGTLPLHHLADGAGLVTARADWTYQSTWLSFQLGNMIAADHQSESPGAFQLSRGADQLLINGNSPNEQQYPKCFSNTVQIDDDADGAQTYRFNPGAWYFVGSYLWDSGNPASVGAPGCQLEHYEATADHVYASGDYHAAFYRAGASTTADTSATELLRQVVYLRPDYAIVHDRAGTKKASYPKVLRWHFNSLPTVSAPSSAQAGGASAVWNAPVTFQTTVGSSKLFGLTFGTAKNVPGLLPLGIPAASTYASIALLELGDQDPCPLPTCGDTSLLASFTPTPTTLAAQDASAGTPVYALLFSNDFTSPAAPMNVRYTSVFQTATAATAAMDACTPLFSADNSLEGTRIGQSVVLFGKDGAITGGFTYATGTATSTLNHLIVDLVPGASYTVSVSAGTGGQTLSASAEGVLAFSTTPPSAASQTVTVSRN